MQDYASFTLKWNVNVLHFLTVADRVLQRVFNNEMFTNASNSGNRTGTDLHLSFPDIHFLSDLADCVLLVWLELCATLLNTAPHSYLVALLHLVCIQSLL